MAISGDIALVGAPGNSGAARRSGAAYVFVGSATGWSQQAKLLPSDGEAYNGVGTSVAINGDTAVVGSPFKDSGGSSEGSAYFFVRRSATWTEAAKLTASDGELARPFGISVGMHESTLVVGALRGKNAGIESGLAYVYDFCVSRRLPTRFPTARIPRIPDRLIALCQEGRL